MPLRRPCGYASPARWAGRVHAHAPHRAARMRDSRDGVALLLLLVLVLRELPCLYGHPVACDTRPLARWLEGAACWPSLLPWMTTLPSSLCVTRESEMGRAAAGKPGATAGPIRPDGARNGQRCCVMLSPAQHSALQCAPRRQVAAGTGPAAGAACPAPSPGAPPAVAHTHTRARACMHTRCSKVCAQRMHVRHCPPAMHATRCSHAVAAQCRAPRPGR